MKPEDIAKKVREAAEDGLKKAQTTSADDQLDHASDQRDRRPAKETDEHITLRKRRRPSGNDNE
ncbi:hypothetical protein [Herpetosiphon sp. NSE202]|uniref:hypothetical protein n=1 Tax=Herpetosiphon sp. NSE202 TaxID=3351349 RepID=UPI00362E54F2